MQKLAVVQFMPCDHEEHTAEAYRRTKTNELTVLIENSKGEIQKLQAKLADIQKEMNERMKRLLGQISRSLKGDFKL